MRIFYRLAMLFLTGIAPMTMVATGYNLPFEVQETPLYYFEELVPQTALQMNYASSEILNPDEWKKVKWNAEAESITLVFTKYPADSANWRTPYDQLLNKRLASLFALDPTLNNRNLKWKMVLQTRCRTEETAKTFFHGFVIKYKVKTPRIMRHVNTIWDIESIVSGQAIPADTALMQVFNRNPQWKNALVIMDWTGSMYPYGAQLLLWHKRHFDWKTIRHFVFFNDGNHKATSQKQIGRTGGIYHISASSLMGVIETMSTVMENGWGGDSPENDLEAVLKGTKLITGYDEVILLADNASSVRDISLVTQVNKPVHVVLVDALAQRIHPDYLQIALHSGGSIHTRQGDFSGFDTLKEGGQIVVNGFSYRLIGGKLLPM